MIFLFIVFKIIYIYITSQRLRRIIEYGELTPHKEPGQKQNTAEAVDEQRADRIDAARLAAVLTDQGVGTESRRLPEEREEREVIRADQPDHESDETDEIKEKPSVRTGCRRSMFRMFLHITDCENQDRRTDQRSDKEHNPCQVIDPEKHQFRLSLMRGQEIDRI